jgi:hypothetical protein
MPEKNISYVAEETISCQCRDEGFLIAAEMELKSFVRAVTRLYGPDEALHSISDWIEECERLLWPRNGGAPDWRRVTIAAAARLSRRTS